MMNLLLKCKDEVETKQFYADVLGFEVFDSEENTCTVTKSGGSIIFSSGENLGAAPVMSGTIYFFINDVDDYYQQIKNRVDVQWPLQDMSYGTREFGIKDCNGYYLAFAQDGKGKNSWPSQPVYY